MSLLENISVIKWKEVLKMAFVITNGKYYIYYSTKGGIKKTQDINKAIVYETIKNAIDDMWKAPSKTESYYVYDMETEQICWRWLTEEEKGRVREEKRQRMEERVKHTKRKNFTQEKRKMIYDRAGGRCQLCGRKILYKDMTIDHIIPLAMNGNNSDDNLQCACKSCNRQKAAYLPEEFIDGVTRIFLYQMESKYAGKVRWKIIKGLMNGMV